MREEPSKREVWPFVPVPVPIFLPFSIGFFDELLTRAWPKEYEEVLNHLRNARIEVLKAVDAAIKKKIEKLEKEAVPKKEKVKVE